MKIQLDIPLSVYNKIKLYKDIEGLNSLEEAIIKLIIDYFKIMSAKLKEKVTFE